MDRILSKCRYLCRHRVFSRSKIYALFSHSSQSCNKSVQDQRIPRSLEDDPSWEAEVLRHEKLLRKLKAEGVDPDDLPFLERDIKVNELPHLIYKKKTDAEKDECLLDDYSAVLLGNTVKTESKVSTETNNLDKDFIRDDVQDILLRIHQSDDISKACRRRIEERKEMPTIKFLTDQQLKEEMQKIAEKMKQKTKMLPVMVERKPCDEIISNDTILEGHETSNISFVDISMNLKPRERFIVIRQPDGVLRKANWEERDRLMQTYYPIPHRKIIPSSLFCPDNFKNVFSHSLHENALDQCVIQFAPDSKEYIQFFEAIYDDVDKNKLYEILRGTRYFGGFVFHLVKNFQLDGLILNMLETGRLVNAFDCVKLLMLLHPQCKTKDAIERLTDDDVVPVIKTYIQCDSKERKLLTYALKKIEEQQVSKAN